MNNEIIIYSPQPTKPLSEASIAKCYGAIISGRKCFIHKPDYCGDAFKVYSPFDGIIPNQNALTLGNSFTPLNSNSLRGVLDKLAESDYPIYEFEDAKTLFKWMSE
jgi:hypothetical protein